MTPERDLKFTLIKYLEYKNEKELSNMIKHSRIVYNKLWEFTGIVSDQRKMCINIKMPLEFKFIVKQSEEKMNILRNLCFEIYEDDDEYAATSVEVSVLADKVTEIEIEEIEKVIIENSVYQSFIKELYDMNIDEVEKRYLYEACECASRGNLLAGATMLGCSAEYLLINMCKAYQSYILKNKGATEADIFERKVINAKNAYTRLDEFQKRIVSEKDLLKKLGFENIALNFNFLDIIRKVRNEAGHPTGNIVSQEELQMTFGNYQHFLKRSHHLIDKLIEDSK